MKECMRAVPIKFPPDLIREGEVWLGDKDMSFAAAVRLGLRLLIRDGYVVKRGCGDGEGD